MKAINSSDTLFVTVTRLGRTVLSTSISGADSLGDVTRSILPQLPAAAGLVSISLRNGSQGWAHSYNVRF